MFFTSLFDDVIRKIPPPTKAYDPNRRIELNDEKSKLGLGEVYEQEFLRQTTTQSKTLTEKEAKVTAAHEEINTLIDKLFTNLDALSNWHFTPKPVKAELSILPASTTPAISMEEATPASTSDAMLLAPKEVYDGTLQKSTQEKESADKKRDRAHSKKRARLEKKEKELYHKLIENTRAEKGDVKRVSVKSGKESATRELMGQSNVTIVADAGNKKGLGSVKQNKILAKVVKSGEKVEFGKKGKSRSGGDLRL